MFLLFSAMLTAHCKLDQFSFSVKWMDSSSSSLNLAFHRLGGHYCVWAAAQMMVCLALTAPKYVVLSKHNCV